MKPVSINDYFNSENTWAKRLLGFSEFQKKRDLQQIENEYNLDKYAGLLKFEHENIEACKTKEFALAGLAPDSTIHISFGDSVFSTTTAIARSLYKELIKAKVEQYLSKNVCELGCGYGYNLSFFNCNVYGGEYTKNAVKLGQKLGYNIQEFNYYNEQDYDFITPDTTILTVHSIEQVPDASAIIRGLEKHKDKIKYVVHFEPTVVKERTSLLGLMRNKYMEQNDYNRNLIELLKVHPGIEILELQTDFFGIVPLNTSNLIVWKFKN